MKVKNDHRSKFSSLSYWKEEAWHGGHGFESRWSPDCFFFFFQASSFQCLNWKIYCDDHSSLSATIIVNRNQFSSNAMQPKRIYNFYLNLILTCKIHILAHNLGVQLWYTVHVFLISYLFKIIMQNIFFYL